MVFFSQLGDVLPQNCLSYLRLKAFWARRGKHPSEILRRYLREIGRSSSKSFDQKASNVFLTWMEAFTCKCGWLLHSPCSLSCGHTICKICFDKSQLCPFCGEERGNYILNTTLDGLLEHWYPMHYNSSTLKGKAYVLMKEKKYENAIELLNEALELISNDFTALNLRSEAYHGLRNVKRCFRDARKSCQLNDSCGESYFRLGEAFALLNKLDDSVEAFNKCLELEPEDGDLNIKVVDCLDRLLSMSPGSEVSISDDSDDDDDDGEPKEKLHNSEKTETDSEINKIINRSSLKSNALPTEEQLTASTKRNQFCQEINNTIEVEIRKTSDEATDNSSVYSTSSTSEASSSGTSKKRQRELSPKVVERKTQKLVTEQTPQLDDFECKLCFCLLFQPVTTACGHVFCKKCLEKCIDYNPSCPICRRKLSCMESTGVGNVTLVIENAIEHLFPEEIEERKRKHESHMVLMSRVGEDEEVDVPIFACTLALPGIQCPLHVFEPKYRAMLRECLESGSNKFGMCKAEKGGGFLDYGTIVEVKHVRYLEDGRSIVDTVGGRRFKVKERSLQEGISFAKVEYFEDDRNICATDEDFAQLVNKCRATYDTLSTYIGNLHPSERECILNALGPLPLPQQNPLSCENGDSWVWWALCALPLNEKAKTMMFKSQSLLDRVTILQRFLNFLTKVRQSRQMGNTS